MKRFSRRGRRGFAIRGLRDAGVLQLHGFGCEVLGSFRGLSLSMGHWCELFVQSLDRECGRITSVLDCNESTSS